MKEKEYKIRSELATKFESNINKTIEDYNKKHNNDIRYFIHYPLIYIEMGNINNCIPNTDSILREKSFGFLVKKHKVFGSNSIIKIKYLLQNSLNTTNLKIKF